MQVITARKQADFSAFVVSMSRWVSRVEIFYLWNPKWHWRLCLRSWIRNGRVGLQQIKGGCSYSLDMGVWFCRWATTWRSLRLSSGLPRRSSIFCFRAKRTLRFGSEAESTWPHQLDTNLQTATTTLASSRGSDKQPSKCILTHVLRYCWFPFIIYLKLELLTQLTVQMNEKYLCLWKIDIS